ncbi:MAG: hypothetical protein OZ948_15635 [Deltaproteobacteria bacterium]|nr:hypothetical protein [Deltaproteobacteria bacterium]
MIPDPLHPAIVHFPVAIAALLPFALALAAGSIVAGSLDRSAWAGVVLLHAVGAGTAWAALATGHAQEERVERALGEAIEEPLHEHEESAERLLWVFAGSLPLTIAGLLGGPTGSRARVAAVVGGIVVGLVAVPAGRSGGALVYEHGAAAAYAPPPAPAPPASEPGS